MNENKVSHIVSFGLYPNMRDEMIKRVRDSYFTMGVDASVIHQLGILKYVDIHLRYWSETAGRVEDAFFDTHTVGHEPADLMTKVLMKSLLDSGLPLTRVISLSRDNPTVMQALFRLLKQELEDRGNPSLIDLICYLHGKHTAFEKCEEALAEEELQDEDDVNVPSPPCSQPSTAS